MSILTINELKNNYMKVIEFHLCTVVCVYFSENVCIMYVCMYVCIMYVCIMYVLCMYVYMYVCIYVCMYVFMYVCIYVPIYVFIYLSIYLYSIFPKAYDMIEEMRRRIPGVNLEFYLDTETLEAIYKAHGVDVPIARGVVIEKEQDDEEIIEEVD